MGMILTLNLKFSAKVQFKTSATWTCAVLHLFFYSYLPITLILERDCLNSAVFILLGWGHFNYVLLGYKLEKRQILTLFRVKFYLLLIKCPSPPH